MIALKLLATTVALMSSLVAAAPTGPTRLEVIRANLPQSLAPAEGVDNTLDCHREMQECVWDSPVIPVTLAWYAECADKYRECIKDSKIISERSQASLVESAETTTTCNELLDMCLVFYSPKTIETVKRCNDVYDRCASGWSIGGKTKREESVAEADAEADICDQNLKQCLDLIIPRTLGWNAYCHEMYKTCVEHNPKTKRDVTNSEELTTKYSTNTVKRTPCNDACSDGFQACLHSLGSNPPQHWWLHCTQKETQCNRSCDCSQQCLKEYGECIGKAPANGIELVATKCMLRLIGCSSKCTPLAKRSNLGADEGASSDIIPLTKRSEIEKDKTSLEALTPIVKRTECTDECYDSYLSCLGSLGGNPPQHWHLYCHEGLAKCNGNCPA